MVSRGKKKTEVGRDDEAANHSFHVRGHHQHAHGAVGADGGGGRKLYILCANNNFRGKGGG